MEILSVQKGQCQVTIDRRRYGCNKTQHKRVIYVSSTYLGDRGAIQLDADDGGAVADDAEKGEVLDLDVPAEIDVAQVGGVGGQFLDARRQTTQK